MASQSDLNKDIDSFNINTNSSLFSHTITIENELGSVLTSRINTSRIISLIHEHTREAIREEKRRTKKNYFCRYCPPEDPKGHHAATSGLKLHLKKHDIKWSAEQNTLRTTPRDIGEAYVQELWMKLVEKGESNGFEGEVLKRTIEKKAIKSTLLDLIIVRRLPFRCVEWPEFHAFIKVLNREADHTDFIPVHHSTITDWIMERFQNDQDTVRKLLQSAKTNIHLAVDIWTSPNHSLILGICASFVDVHDSYHNIVIGLRTVHSQSGEDQWDALLPVLKTYDIEKKIGALVGDNTGSNNTLCRIISQYLFLTYQIRWNETHQRLRC
jgi:hypothetical protein